MELYVRRKALLSELADIDRVILEIRVRELTGQFDTRRKVPVSVTESKFDVVVCPNYGVIDLLVRCNVHLDREDMYEFEILTDTLSFRRLPHAIAAFPTPHDFQLPSTDTLIDAVRDYVDANIARLLHTSRRLSSTSYEIAFLSLHAWVCIRVPENTMLQSATLSGSALIHDCPQVDAISLDPVFETS